jgi:hypothetical protein
MCAISRPGPQQSKTSSSSILLVRYLWSCGLPHRLAVELGENALRSAQSTVFVGLVREEFQVHPHSISQNTQRLYQFIGMTRIERDLGQIVRVSCDNHDVSGVFPFSNSGLADSFADLGDSQPGDKFRAWRLR